MGTYRFLEDVAIADAAFQAEAESLEELFALCAQAAFDVMADTETIEHRSREQVELAGQNLDELLFDWLAELIYLKDLKSMLFSKFDIEIQKKNGYSLKASIWGEPADQKKHRVRVDVKAVTYHLLEVKKEDDKWTARVILDT
ncbi:MAG: archease [Candidatus Zixiibacteriota bacterium]|jgi:SHS2 domain-containing protein